MILKSFRHNSSTVRNVGYQSSLPTLAHYKSFFCSIRIKPNFHFSSLLLKQNQYRAHRSKKIHIAFLIPTKSVSDNIRHSPLYLYFIPSLLNTISFYEMSKYHISLFIGFDSDDILFGQNADANFNIKSIKNLLPKSIDIIFNQILNSNWLTFVWNCLFVIAFKSGAHYFIQINDDVIFKSKGWISSTVALLPLDSIGVVGLNDESKNCSLFTQCLVNRKHYEMFEGLFFPNLLRNWYSDDWITSVYPKNFTKCNYHGVIKNSNVKRRYQKCDNRYFKLALQKGQTLLQNNWSFRLR